MGIHLSLPKTVKYRHVPKKAWPSRLGQHHLALYDREALETQVFPRLTGAKSISAWDMQMTLIRMGHPQGVATVVAIVGAFIAGVAYALIR